MKLLLFLNKFEIDKNMLKSKIKDIDNNAKFEDEDHSILLTTQSEPEKLLKFQEISKISILATGWKDFSFKNLKEECLKLCKENNIKNFKIETKFYDKVPISSKSIYRHINPYLKHEGILFNKDENMILIEIKKFGKILKSRLSYSTHKLWNKINPIGLDLSNIYVVLEEPRLPDEISDFLRLCYIFKMPLIILTKDKENIKKPLEKAKKITKGIDYENFDLRFLPHLSKDFIKVGFSKHSTDSENNLMNFFKENHEYKICLIFGNDTYGLSQNVRDDLDYCFRLTPEIKKPLKANQALSYVLGIYAGLNL